MTSSLTARMGESFAMVTALALRVLCFSPLPKNHTSKFQFDLQRTDTNEVLRALQCFGGEKKLQQYNLQSSGQLLKRALIVLDI